MFETVGLPQARLDDVVVVAAVGVVVEAGVAPRLVGDEDTVSGDAAGRAVRDEALRQVADLAKSSNARASRSSETKSRLVGLSAIRTTISASGVQKRTRVALI
ncbi:hypothetical protein ACIBP6_07325 [Nonomuraea terrae]|uniref:hypothetical protein n=1 Tax=Nonomuraea terrae TaxID=2530383 RepID=UPI003793B9BF